MGALNRAVVKGGRDPMCQHGRVTTEHIEMEAPAPRARALAATNHIGAGRQLSRQPPIPLVYFGWMLAARIMPTTTHRRTRTRRCSQVNDDCASCGRLGPGRSVRSRAFIAISSGSRSGRRSASRASCQSRIIFVECKQSAPLNKASACT
jgi:hypothetical protein